MAPSCCRAQPLSGLYHHANKDVKALPNNPFWFPGDPKLLGRFARVAAGWHDCLGCSLCLQVSRTGSSLKSGRLHCPSCTNCQANCLSAPLTTRPCLHNLFVVLLVTGTPQGPVTGSFPWFELATGTSSLQRTLKPRTLPSMQWQLLLMMLAWN